MKLFTLAAVLLVLTAVNPVHADEVGTDDLIAELYALEDEAYSTIEEMIQDWREKENPGFSDYVEVYKQARESERRIDKRFRTVLAELELKLEQTGDDTDLVSEIESSFTAKKEEARRRLKEVVME